MHPTVLCPKCYEPFNSSTKSPHLLTCSHSLCAQCIQKQSPFSCPFCNKALPLSPSLTRSFPINTALSGLVEAIYIATRAQVGEECELHDGKHNASFWCANCEKGLCNEGRLTHGKTPSTKSHKVLASNAPRPPLRKPVMCAAHGNDLEFVCATAAHPTRMVCAACAAQTHAGHACRSVEEYFGEKCTLAQEFVTQAQAQQGAEKEEVYKKMLEDLAGLNNFTDAKPATKENLLHEKLNSLFLILDGLTEKLHNNIIPQEEKKEEKGILGMKEREERRREVYGEEDEEEGEEEDDVEDFLEGKRFIGGRKNEFGGGKTQRAKDKW